MKFIILIFGAAILISCSTTSWKHPVKKPTSSYLDQLHCKQEAKNSVLESGLINNNILIKKETDKCMIKKYGWIKEEKYPLLYYLPFPFNLFLAYQ